jgi:TRAP-type C4-dicarboxylate transport system permease small subunit
LCFSLLLILSEDFWDVFTKKKRALKTMGKLLISYEKGLTYLAMVCTAAITVLTTVDATGRYFFNRPIAGAYEFTESYLMVSLVFLGLCCTYRGGGLIRVNFFIDRMPLWVKMPLNYFVQVFSMLLGIFFLIATVWQGIRSILSGVTLGFFHIPAWPPYMIVCIGVFSMTLAMVLDLWKIRSGQSCLLKGLSSET